MHAAILKRSIVGGPFLYEQTTREASHAVAPKALLDSSDPRADKNLCSTSILSIKPVSHSFPVSRSRDTCDHNESCSSSCVAQEGAFNCFPAQADGRIQGLVLMVPKIFLTDAQEEEQEIWR